MSRFSEVATQKNKLHKQQITQTMEVDLPVRPRFTCPEIENSKLKMNTARYVASKSSNARTSVRKSQSYYLERRNSNAPRVVETIVNDRGQNVSIADEEESSFIGSYFDDEKDNHISEQVISMKDDKDGDDHEGEQEYIEVQLSRDTFSFMIAAKLKSIPFATSVGVLALKTSIFGLILSDLVNTNNQNPLGIPAAVTVPVTLTQVRTFCLCVTKFE